jgi:RNA polymerase sigma-70 factor, ECF subfamily
MSSDINSLVERWKGGDEAAAEALYNHHRARLFGLACSLLGDAADADDVTQITLVYALTNIARYSPERSSFNTWLHTIAISRCRDRLRRRKPFLFSFTHWLSIGQDIPEAAPSHEHRTAYTEARSEVMRAVQSLSQPLREAVLLRFWAGHTFREMAEILGCPVATAQSRVRLAYGQLRTTLAETGPAWLAELEEEHPSG